MTSVLYTKLSAQRVKGAMPIDPQRPGRPSGGRSSLRKRLAHQCETLNCLALPGGEIFDRQIERRPKRHSDRRVTSGSWKSDMTVIGVASLEKLTTLSVGKFSSLQSAFCYSLRIHLVESVFSRLSPVLCDENGLLRLKTQRSIPKNHKVRNVARHKRKACRCSGVRNSSDKRASSIHIFL
jgi:hypothetical protein